MWNAAQQRLGVLGRPFRLLIASDALTLLALMAGHVAVPWWIAHEGGAHHLAMWAGALALGSILALPALSPLGDRLSKRTLITGGLLVMLVDALVLAGLAQAGIYRIGWIIGLELLGVIGTAAIMPATFSIVAELLPPEQLSEGLAVQKSAQSLGRLFGPLLGGGLLAVAGTELALWGHAALLLLAAVLAARIEAPTPVRGLVTAAHWWADLRAGLAAKWHIRLERGWTFVSFLVMVFFGPAIGMLVPLKVQALGLSGGWLGACEAGLSAGMLAGSLGVSTALATKLGRFRTSVGSIFCEGLGLALIGLASVPWMLVPLMGLVGLCISNVSLVGQTHRMLAIPPNYRARMTSVNMMAFQVAGVLGPALAGLGLAAVSVHAVYLAFGTGLFMVGWGYFLVPGYRGFLNLPHDQASGYYGRMHPELFR